MTLTRFAALYAALITAVCIAPPTFAQDKMGGKMSSEKKMDKSVAVCEKCKMVMSAADAKKIKLKDAMGHSVKLVKKAPAGYKMAGGKM